MRRLAPLAALAALVSMQQPALSQEGDAFFRGKTIRFILGAAPGQEYDLWTRLMTRHLPRYIEGNPNFIVENMTGAGFIVATNWLYNRAARDGTMWGMANHNVADQALSKIPNVSYDPAKFNWIGTPEVTNRGCFSLSSATAKSADDLFKTEMIMGATAAGSPVTQTPRLMKNLLGMKFKIVTGYARPQDAILSMERGEVEGVCQTVQSFNLARPDWMKTGKSRVLFTTEEERVPGVDAPSIMEFAKTDEQRAILRYYNSGAELGRPIMLPPDVPQDRVQMLRRAFDRTMQDPEFLKEAAASKYVISPRTGEKLAEIIQRQMTTPPDIIDKTADLTLKP